MSAIPSPGEHLAWLYRMQSDATALVRDAESGGDRKQIADCKKLSREIEKMIRAAGGEPDL